MVLPVVDHLLLELHRNPQQQDCFQGQSLRECLLPYPLSTESYSAMATTLAASWEAKSPCHTSTRFSECHHSAEVTLSTASKTEPSTQMTRDCALTQADARTRDKRRCE